MDEQVKGECFCMGAGPQATAMAKVMVSGPAMEHFKASRLEFLKGLRSLLDSRIEKMSHDYQSKGASVEVE